MITYKGNKLVIGKRFIYENEVLKYLGKIYGDSYNFSTEDNNREYILSESDLEDLKEYKIINEANLLAEEDENDFLKDKLIDYTKKELDLLNDLINGKSDDTSELLELYRKEYNDFRALNNSEYTSEAIDNISLEAQLYYLNSIYRNISETNIISLLANLKNYIKTLEKGDE